MTFKLAIRLTLTLSHPLVRQTNALTRALTADKEGILGVNMCPVNQLPQWNVKYAKNASNIVLLRMEKKHKSSIQQARGRELALRSPYPPKTNGKLAVFENKAKLLGLGQTRIPKDQ